MKFMQHSRIARCKMLGEIRQNDWMKFKFLLTYVNLVDLRISDNFSVSRRQANLLENVLQKRCWSNLMNVVH